eukprot:TRINITY_DN1368_c0_g1_i1.p1 TRINITY_DN1368_c0_g1~~TRINITY_DN1368_c0_g1_i1.p1  ORF type:complete len:221 (+),score=11.30 TRINITY_DN1368_c0_g1_i1:46-708(+)
MLKWAWFVAFVGFTDGLTLKIPHFPEQFSARIRVKSPCKSVKGDYPPCERLSRVFYDFPNQRATVNWVIDFEDHNTTIVKRFDLGREYEVRRICTEMRCKLVCHRTPLGPSSKLERPAAVTDQNTKQSHYFPGSNGMAPYVKWNITHEDVWGVLKTDLNGLPLQIEGEHVTYMIDEFKTGAPHPSRFVLPHAWEPKSICGDAPNPIGIGYQHVLHHFVRI